MFSIPIKTDPVKLKIRCGAGATNAELLDLINQGARLRMYRYAMAFVVLSFLRPSDVYCVRPGQSRLVPGLRYSLVSLLVGWWSIAGVVFTIRALVGNFRGGLDVTDQVLAVLRNAPPESSAQLVLSETGISLAPHVPAVPDPVQAAAAAAQRRTDKRFLLAMGVLFMAITIAMPGYVLSHFPLALVNGTDAPYDVWLDGEPIHLAPHSARVLAVTVGTHRARAVLPGRSERVWSFHVGGDWYNPLTPRCCTIVNLDRRALIAEEHQIYGHLEPAPPEPSPRIWAGREVLTPRNPYYFFEEFPRSVELPANTKGEVRNRIGLITPGSNEEGLRLLFVYGTPDDLRGYRDATAPDGTRANAADVP